MKGRISLTGGLTALKVKRCTALIEILIPPDDAAIQMPEEGSFGK